MRIILLAATQGLRQVLRHWPLVLPLYGIGVGLGLLQTWPLLTSGAWHNPFLNRLATGGADALADLFLAAEGATAVAALWVAASLALPLLFAIAYTFVSGGLLHVYAGVAPFWAGCRRLFWSFAGLGVLIFVLAAISVAVAVALGAALGARAGLVVAGLLLLGVSTIGEYARAQAVVRGRRNPFVLLGQAIGFCARNAAGVLLLALLALLLQAALLILFGLISPFVSSGPIGVIWQQLTVLAWIFLKFLQLAWALFYIKEAHERHANPADASVVPAAA